MRILEEFWYGNIEPTEYDTNACKEYKEVLRLITRNEEKLQATLPLGSWAKMLLPSALISFARTEWGISVPNTLILLP